ncbi:MAG: hypothetical protein HRT35_32160 [Algicola sp.]|nr:hypothetical protein [Algicola sp.]
MSINYSVIMAIAYQGRHYQTILKPLQKSETKTAMNHLDKQQLAILQYNEKGVEIYMRYGLTPFVDPTRQLRLLHLRVEQALGDAKRNGNYGYYEDLLDQLCARLDGANQSKETLKEKADQKKERKIRFELNRFLLGLPCEEPSGETNLAITVDDLYQHFLDAKVANFRLPYVLKLNQPASLDNLSFVALNKNEKTKRYYGNATQILIRLRNTFEQVEITMVELTLDLYRNNYEFNLAMGDRETRRYTVIDESKPVTLDNLHIVYDLASKP